MRYLTVGEVIEIHDRVLQQAGGSSGIRDLALLESALAQPNATFGLQDLHPTVVDKAAALGFSLVANHPFVDGNKRAGFEAASPKARGVKTRPPDRLHVEAVEALGNGHPGV